MEKNILEFSEKEFIAFINATPENYETSKSSIEKALDITKTELLRIEHQVSIIVSKNIGTITVSSLLSLIILVQPSLIFLKQYLVWTAPFLFGAITLFVISSSFKTYRVLQFTVSGDRSQLLIQLRNELKSYQFQWEGAGKALDHCRRYGNICTAISVAYVTSFTLDFYFFIFSSTPNIKESILIGIVALLAGIISYLLIILRHPSHST